MATITFNGTTIPADPDKDLLAQLLDAGLPAQYLCMGGSCRMCRVTVVSGGEHLEERGINEYEGRIGADARLACQCRPLGTGDVVLEQ